MRSARSARLSCGVDGTTHDAELHGREHRLPQRRHVGQHEQQPVAAARAAAAERVGDPVAPRGELGEREPHVGRVVGHEPERGAVVARGVGVEPVQRPVEAVEDGPAEVAVGVGVPVAMREQELARVEEGLRGPHGGPSHGNPSHRNTGWQSPSICAAPAPAGRLTAHRRRMAGRITVQPSVSRVFFSHPSHSPHLMLRLAPLTALAILAVAAPPAFAQQGDTLPETVLRSAERALQDDSLETVTTRWRARARA